MNRNYKVIWNASLGCFMAVAEYAKSRGKSSSSAVTSGSNSSVTCGARLLRLSALCAGMALSATSMQALAVQFNGDSGGSTQSRINANNDQIKITGGITAAADLSNNNIGVLVDSSTRTLTVKLAKDIDLSATGSLTIGGSVLDDNGLTLTSTNPAAGKAVISVGNVSGEKRVSFNGAKIVGVANGDLNSSSKQAVKGGQLFGTAQSIANNLGGGSIVNSDGTVSAPTYNVRNSANTSQNTVADAIEALNKGFKLQSNNATNVSNIQPSETVDIGTATGETNIKVAKAGNIIDFSLNKVLDLSAAGSLTIGDSVLDNSGLTLASGAKFTSAGINAAGQKITGVADGSIGLNSNQAVNGSQLFATNQNVDAAQLAADDAQDTADLGFALSDANDVKVSKSLGDSVKIVGSNPNLTTQVNGGNLEVKLNNTLDLSATGSLTIGDSVLDNSGLTLANGTSNQVKLTADATGLSVNQSKIVDLADGIVDATSQQAINGRQLFATNNLIADLTNGTTGIVREDNGNGALNVGSTAGASGDNSIAMGVGAIASGDSSISIGTGNIVRGNNSGAIGDPTIINGANSYSVGNNNTLDGDGAFILGNDNRINAGSNDSSIIGNNNEIQGQRSLALGKGNTIRSTDAFALGNGINIGANLDGAVGIGNGTTVEASTIASFDPTGPTNIVGTATGSNVVSIGSAGNERRLTNVAAGGADTDAVNVSQLKAVDGKVNLGIKIGGDTGADQQLALGDTISVLGGSNLTTTASAAGITVDLNNTIDLTPAGSVTVGRTLVDDNGIEITGTNNDVFLTRTGLFNGGNKIRGVTNGNVAANSKDAINGSQLFETNTNVAGNTAALGGSFVGGIYTAPIYNIDTNDAAGVVTTTGYNTVGDALAALNGSVQTPLTFAGDTGADVTRQLGQKLSITGGETIAANLATGNNVGVIANGTDGLLIQLAKDIDLGADGSVTTGNSVLDDSGLTLASGAKFTSAGINAGGQKITNVADGFVGQNSKQAVNGRQLFATNNLIADLTNGTTGIVREDNGNGALSVGSTADASGGNSIAMGVGAIASGDSSISIGTGNNVSGNNSGAIGDPTIITGNNSYSLGNDNIISGNKSFTVGNDNNVRGNRASTLGNDNLIGGNRSSTIGNNNNVSGDRAFALGNNNTISSNAAFALGNNITIGTGLNGAVGIGNNTNVTASTDASFTPTGSTVIGTATGNNVVSIGSAGNERRLTNVAAGGADTDAVNVSQLKGVDIKAEGNAAALGGNVVNGVYVPPQYSVFTDPSNTSSIGGTGTVVNNVGAAFTAINTALQTPLTFTGDTGTATRQLGQTLSITGGATGNLTTGNIGVEADETGGLVVKLAEKIDLGADGSVTTGNTVTDNDGVLIDDTTGNVTALTATGTKVTDSTNTSEYGANGFTTTDGTNTTFFNQNGLRFEDANGALGPSITASGIDAGNQQITGVLSGGALNDVNSQSNAANIGDLSSAIGDVTTLGFGIKAADGNTVNKNLGDAVEIIGSNSNITTKENGGKIEIELNNTLDLTTAGSIKTGNTVMDSNGLTFANGTSNQVNLTTDARGLSVNQSKIVDILDGNVNGSSQQAINGRQLFNTATSIANNFGGGSVVNTDGTVSAPSYTLNGVAGAANNVGAALTNIDNRVITNTSDIATNVSAINDLTNGTTGIVQQLPNGTGDITVGAGVGGTEVNFTGTAGDRVLTGVANGAVAAGSNDAVTGDQLFGTADSITDIIGGNAALDPDGKITTSDIGGTGKNNIHDAIGAVNTAAAQAKSTVSGSSNVTVNATPASSPGPINYEVVINDDIDLKSVTSTDVNGNKTVLSSTGTTIVNAAGDTNNSTATSNIITDGANVTTVTGSGTKVTDGTNTTNYGADGFTINNGPSRPQAV